MACILSSQLFSMLKDRQCWIILGILGASASEIFLLIISRAVHFELWMGDLGGGGGGNYRQILNKSQHDLLLKSYVWIDQQPNVAIPERPAIICMNIEQIPEYYMLREWSQKKSQKVGKV